MLVCPYTPKHNGIIEHVRQTLMSATAALLSPAGLEQEYIGKKHSAVPCMCAMG